jgi:pimeloyl-ACP methyl ester carboxylesterase
VTRHHRTLAAGLAACLAVAGCEAVLRTNVDTARAGAGVAPVAASDVLDEAAGRRAESMCAAGSAAPLADPYDAYGMESAAGLHELVGSAPLDPGIADGVQRNLAATDEVWAGFAADPELVDPRWDGIGLAEHTCADGELYVAAVLRDDPSMPASGRFASTQFTQAQVQVTSNVVYRSTTNHLGQPVDLLLDLYLPPGDGQPLPVVVLIHGGSFTTGSKAGMASAATAYARLGYAAIAINYRLRPIPTYDQLVLAAVDAMVDGIEAVRWIRGNAPTYGLDPDRIAPVGTSAGGYVALAIANLESAPPATGPLAGVTAEAAAAVSTGANLSSASGFVTFDEGDAPALMFHYEQDTGPTNPTGEYAFQTCAAMRAAGATCDFVLQPGSGHTTNLTPGGPWWTSEIGPFLWLHLGLDDR